MNTYFKEQTKPLQLCKRVPYGVPYGGGAKTFHQGGANLLHRVVQNRYNYYNPYINPYLLKPKLEELHQFSATGVAENSTISTRMDQHPD